MSSYTTRDEAITREIVEVLGTEAADYDIEAIAAEVLDTEGEGAQYRYIVAVDTDEFWAIVAKHARALPAGANAIYTNADGTIELVEMSAEDEVLEVIATLTEAQELAIYAGETEYRAVGADVSLGDGDTLRRLTDR